MEPTERDLTGLDVERPLPLALAARLEAALLDEAARRPAEVGDETAALLADIDEPLPLPATTRRALERALIPAVRRSRWQVPVAAAVVLLLVLATAAALTNNRAGDDTVAAGRPGAKPPAADVTTPTTTAQDPLARTSTNGRAFSAGPTTTQCASCASSAPDSPGEARPAAPAAAAADGQVRGSYVGAVDPSSGPLIGGTTVTIRGGGFTGANGVLFGTTPATNFSVISDTEIQAASPPSSQPGAVAVVVTFPDGRQTPAGPENQFTYTAAP
jgi:hypothetical protein